MKHIVCFSAPLSIVLVLALLPLANAVAQDERIQQIDRRVLDPASAVVAEADISSPPVELSEAAKLQFLEQVVSQPPRMQAMSGSFTGLRTDLLAKLVKLLPVFLLEPKKPFDSRVISDKNVAAGLRFHSSTLLNSVPNLHKPNGYASFDGGVGSNSYISVIFNDLPLNTLYLLDVSLSIVGDGSFGAGELQLDSVDSTVCWIDFLHAPKVFALQGGPHHVLAIVEQLTTATQSDSGTCELRLRLQNEGSWYFYSLQITEP